MLLFDVSVKEMLKPTFHSCFTVTNVFNLVYQKVVPTVLYQLKEIHILFIIKYLIWYSVQVLQHALERLESCELQKPTELLSGGLVLVKESQNKDRLQEWEKDQHWLICSSLFKSNFDGTINTLKWCSNPVAFYSRVSQRSSCRTVTFD